MQQEARETPKDNDLFYTCGLVDYIARKTKNTRSTIVNKLDSVTIAFHLTGILEKYING